MTKAGVKVELWDNLFKLFPKKTAPAKTPSGMNEKTVRARLDRGRAQTVRGPVRILLRRRAF